MKPQKFQTPIEVLHAWINAVNNKDLEAVLNLYAENAVLMPTFSPHPETTREKLVKYFTTLSERPNLSVTLLERTVITQTLTDSIAVLSGLYKFEFEIDDSLVPFASRFSFVVDLELDHPILHHHSAQLPRTLS